MTHEFILYAAISGAICFGVVWIFSKNEGLSSIVSIALGLILIVFVFPEPEPAKGIVGVLNHLTSPLIKILWGIGWGIGIFSAYVIAKKVNP